MHLCDEKVGAMVCCTERPYMIYSIPYVLLTVFLGLLALLHEKYKDDPSVPVNITAVGILMFFVFFGFRGFVFHDWTSYYVEFEEIDVYKLSTYEFGNIKEHEPGWLLLSILCKGIINNYHFFIFVITLADVILFCRFLKRYTDNILLSMVIFLAFGGFASMCNLLRNILAIMIFVNALPYLEKRKPIPYFLLCVLAFSFHYSSIFFFPLYFFLHRHTNKYVYLAIVIVCNIVFVLHVPILLSLVKIFHVGGDFLERKIEVYTETTGSRGIGLGFLERLLTALLIFCYYDKLTKARKSNCMFVNAFLLYLTTFSALSEFDEIAKRFSILYLFSYWILWPEIRKCFYFPNNRLLFNIFLGLYCVLKIVTTVNHVVMEYDNILLGGIKSYQERKYIFSKEFQNPDE